MERLAALVISVKMSTSIMAELLSAINARQYKQIIPSLAEGSGLSELIFPKTTLAVSYALVTKRWLDGSYMNLNALFELFGECNNESGMQMWKRMLKFLGITKKHGVDKCNILKNSWIALHMHGITARQWVDSMFLRDTPGDEIALYTLCKMYHRHCVVVTSAKLWTTLETTTSMTEADIMEACELHLLYIEPGVFSELWLKPAIPPPPSSTFVAESATEILPDRADMSERVGSPLNLCVTHTATETSSAKWLPEIDSSTPIASLEPAVDYAAISDNDIHVDIEYTVERFTKNVNKYSDCRLSDALDRVHLEWDVDVVMNTVSNTWEANEPSSGQVNDDAEADPSTSNPPIKSAKPVPNMISCMVKLDKLTTQDIKYWSNPRSSGYFLRMRNAASTTSRPYLNANQNISYFSDAETSSSEDHTVGPGKWNKPRVRNIHHPSRGPSKARIASQLSIQKKKELAAVEGLLSLQHTSEANTESDDNTGNNTDSRTSSSSGKSESIHTLSSLSEHDGDDGNSTHSENCSTCDGSSTADKDDDDVPLAKIKQELANMDNKSQMTTEKPSAEAKRQITISKGKPYFKTKSFELFKWKRSHVFKCMECDQTETSQQRINKHYREEHGLLLCDICNKTCNTVSALRKHHYEHSDKVNRYSCQDCNKSFPFESQLKNHRKVHLSPP